MRVDTTDGVATGVDRHCGVMKSFGNGALDKPEIAGFTITEEVELVEHGFG